MESNVEKKTDAGKPVDEVKVAAKFCIDALRKLGYVVVVGRVAVAMREDVGMLVSVQPDSGGPMLNFTLLPDGRWTGN